MTPDTSAPKPAILLIGTDAAFLKTVEAALSQSRAVAVSAIAEPIEQAGKRRSSSTPRFSSSRSTPSGAKASAPSRLWSAGSAGAFPWLS